MKCAQVRRRLPQFVDGSLRSRRDARIGHHLARCTRCDEQYARLLTAEEALRGFGDAVRAGDVSVPAPRLPVDAARQAGKAFAWLLTPTPIWAPVASAAAVVALAVVLSAAPDGLSVGWGPPKSGASADAASPPLGARAMLEFVVVPDPTDAGRLAASVVALEEFVDAHPDDLAMHWKLTELYEHQIAHPDLSDELRDATRTRLATVRRTLAALVADGRASQGDTP
ncbi:hypothetical protein CMK11_14395 [Candidatus Poribacteria bacterium]|nr:hypothetical protein [Candidatus Poribacteria bacterium]